LDGSKGGSEEKKHGSGSFPLAHVGVSGFGLLGFVNIRDVSIILPLSTVPLVGALPGI
jgi:hypothetical protein